jgi:hypothetical protein
MRIGAVLFIRGSDLDVDHGEGGIDERRGKEAHRPRPDVEDRRKGDTRLAALEAAPDAPGGAFGRHLERLRPADATGHRRVDEARQDDRELDALRAQPAAQGFAVGEDGRLACAIGR